ncbi:MULTISPECIES: YbaY family lipoprotein [Pseudomonas]|uniref:Lipoprotein n=2 Tax=Pseudomonas TaxID=286 RepID=A0AAX0VTJ0_9PSED|nr:MULTISPECIES: YbaY family lipoprotein [Pseudomonas]MBH3361191.1 YbaY family lipoprotein [Pseudomonas guariconensis]MCO7620303.1 YbaY family lipoprotein [Pseudomonas guariconensis]MDM9592788.1 YbaY family lipoprotein [Pseudomonas guariconensis]MDM9605615.1 YbaY family lipoprotein [Pseudomonas guariconensis]MDM9610572.1 YbaY family lipoprotein [Pseudomonas guariconensis]
MKKLFMLCGVSLLAACTSNTPSHQASLDGEVYYLQRMALPPAATLSVSLQDVSLMDAPAVTLANQAGPVKGNVPLPFHLTYDPTQIKAGHRYAVSARIELDGKLLFINTEHHGVNLDGSDPQPVRIKVDPVR